jgi:rhomboid protease GluP
MIAADKWTAEERIRRWEPPFPNGVDPGFLTALTAQTPQAWATPLLMALSALVFLAMAIRGVDPWSPAAADLIKWGANYGPLTTGGQSWRLLTGAFVHFGAPHFVMNMVVLWQAGFLVERLFGNWGFLIAYLLAALCGSVASLVWNPYIVSAGASGAVFGIYGMFFGYLFRCRDSIPGPAQARLTKIGLAFLALNLVFGLLVPSIDLAAHLGGLLAGFGAGLALAVPLGTKSERGTPGRNLLVLGLGLGAVWGMFALIPHTVDLQAEMTEFYKMQTDTVDLYESARIRRGRGTLSEADFVKIVDEQVRPPWREHLRRLRALHRVRGRIKNRIEKMELYMDLRERAWSKVSEAVRTGDPEKAAEAKALDEQMTVVGDSIRAESN